MRKTISSLCLLIGFCLLVSPQIEKHAYEVEQERLIKTFEDLGQLEDSGEPDQTLKAEMPARDEPFMDGVIGVLRIPAIDMEMAIFEDASEQSLLKGAGVINPLQDIGVHNVGLAGHRSTINGKLFNRLDELARGDLIEIETQNEKLSFEVMNTFVVDRTDIHVLDNQQTPLLTLVTCTPIGIKNPTDRLIIQAKLQKNGGKE